MLKGKMFDNSKKRCTWKTLLRMVVLAPFCLAFAGPEGMTNPLLGDTTEVQPTAAPEGQSTPAPEAGTEQTPTTETAPTGTETPINTPSADVPKPDDVLKNLGLDKFKDITSLGNSYKHIEQQYSKTASENAQLKAQLEQIRQETENAKLQQQQLQEKLQQQQPQGKSPEEIEQDNLALAEEIMNNPLTAIEKIRADMREQILKEVEKDVEGIKQKVAPIIEQNQRAQKQSEWNSKASEFSTAVDAAGNLMHPEISRPEVREAMVNAFNKFPGLHDSEDGLETAYKYALGELNSIGNAPAIDPKTLLSDKTFIEQAAAHPEIIKIATQKYLESIKSGNPPPVMGISTGGSPSAMSNNSPKSIKEGALGFKKLLGL